MKLLKNITSIIAALLLILCSQVYAQQSQRKSNIPEPKWIKMMDDSTANYYEAKKSFDAFWKNKERPTEEKETFENFEKKKDRKVKSAKTADAVKYGFEYKKFLNWQRSVAPYVQADGRILTTAERIELWQQEKKTREAAEEKAKEDQKQ
jgi:hypothetical protein